MLWANSHLINKIRDLPTKIKVSAGFFNAKAATIAYKLEFGGIYAVSPEYKQRAKAKGITLGDRIRIPARAFLLNAFQQFLKLNTYYIVLRMYFKDFSFNKYNLDTMGKALQNNIEEEFGAHHYLPNSPHTIAIKGHNDVLIDTGWLLSQVEHRNEYII